MKIVKNILQYILATVLSLAIFILVIINIFSSHILRKTYILSKLDKEDYYEKIYEEANSNFENYIYQSGLDEEVLNDIVTKEKIQKDTQTIISNIYDGMDEKIDTTEIVENLNRNINNALQTTNISSTQQNAIDTFVDKICEAYEESILHTGYEEKINKSYQEIIKYITLAKKAILVTIGVFIVLLIILTIRRIYRITAKIGTAFVVDGLLLIMAGKYINTKVKIEGITVLNNAISDVIRSILIDMLNNILKYGSVLLTLGIILIIIYALIKSIRKSQREKEQYTPEN